MVQSDMSTPDYAAHAEAHHGHKFCWKSALVGVVVAFMSYLLLSALGAGIVGNIAENMIMREKDGAGVLASGAGVWMGISAVVSLFLGSHFAIRVSRFISPKIGVAHGLAIASIFFLVMVWGGASAVGGATKAAFSMADSAVQASSNVAANSEFQDVVQRAVGSSTLKSSPKEVTEGLISRLASGNPDSAKNYLAYQTGQTPEAVDAKAAQMKAEFEAKAKEAAEATARVVAVTGWSLFVMFLVGLIGAAVGGATATRLNATAPLDHTAHNNFAKAAFRPSQLANERGSAGPYILGWLLGVPGSILFLIFILRAVF